jgi:hypothetical protein
LRGICSANRLTSLGSTIAPGRHPRCLRSFTKFTSTSSRRSGAILTGPGWLYVSPTYHAERLYARAAGSRPLRLERAPELPWHLAEPDVSAVLSADGRLLRIHAVNSTARRLEPILHLDVALAAGKWIRR